MSKIAVVYWSGTGNTEAMAQAIAEGAKGAGAEVDLLGAGEFPGFDGYSAVAFGCPAMGSEVLEESEFEPMFAAIEGGLSGKKIALFGSYGWGDGQWMRDWCERCDKAGADLYGKEGLIVNETPDEAALDACKELGKALANW